MVVLLFVCAGALLIYSFSARHKIRIAIVATITVACALGMVRVVMLDDVRTLNEGMATIDVVVVDEPDIRETNTQYLARILDHGALDDILVILPRYPEYHYGDQLHLEGKLSYPKEFEGTLGRTFDYASYLIATKHASMLMRYPKASFIVRDQANPIRKVMIISKQYLLDTSAQLINEPAQSLLAGMLFGGKQSLGKVWLDHFKHAGLVHIVVLSGYNMTIVTEWLLKIGSLFGYYPSLIISALGIIFFAGMAGGGATVIRAAAMALILLLSRATGRTYAITRALLIVAFFMILSEPRIVLYDPSFQLSFIATLGLIHISPIIDEYLPKKLRQKTLREIVASTIATQIAVFPLLIYSTGIFSLIALPANLLVLPLVPLTMLLGVCAVLAGAVYQPIGFILALPASILLKWILAVTKFAATLPYAVVLVDKFNGAYVFACYLIIIAWVYRHYRRAHPQAR
jgi:competence protein ComEC